MVARLRNKERWHCDYIEPLLYPIHRSLLRAVRRLSLATLS
jgi:hypothetical protein